MHSSISSSDPTPTNAGGRCYGRQAGIFLVGVVLVLLGADTITRVWLPRLSQIEQRTKRELEEALRLQDPNAILLVGNSLLGTGVDMRILNEKLGNPWTAHRLYIENTRYYDWYYGLRYLLDSGCRPGTIVVLFNVQGLFEQQARGEYVVSRLVRWQDIHLLARDLDFDLTRTSNLYFAKASRFYGSRTEIRAYLLSRLVPRFEDLRRDLTPTAKAFPPDEETLPVLCRRLQDLQAIATRCGVRLVIAIPPTLGDDREDLALRAEAVSGVPCLMPLRGNQLTEADFELDRFHLAAPGAARFSEALSSALKRSLTP